MTVQLQALKLESEALQQEGQQLRSRLSALESALGAYSALMLLSSKGWALFGSGSTTAHPTTGGSSPTGHAQDPLQANPASSMAAGIAPTPPPAQGAACGAAGCSSTQTAVPGAAAAAGEPVPPAPTTAAAATAGAAPSLPTAAAAGSVEAQRRAMVQAYQTYLMQAFVVLELCNSAAAAGWRPPPPPALNIPLLDQLMDVEEFHLDLHSLWQGRMAGVLPPGVDLPVFPFTLAQLAECTREEIWGFMNSDMSTGEPCTQQQITEGMPATWRRVAAAGIFRPDQVQFLLRLHHLYIRGIQGLHKEQLQLQHSIKAMQQQLATGARRHSAAAGSGVVSRCASPQRGHSSKAAEAAVDDSSSSTAGAPLSVGAGADAPAAQCDLQHAPLEGGAASAELRLQDLCLGRTPQQQQQTQEEEQDDGQSAEPGPTAGQQGGCYAAGMQRGSCGRHLSLDGWFEDSGASEEACSQLELQFRAAQAKEDAITFAISSTMARVLDPLQHVEILTACWPFYIHGIEVLCALAEQQQQQWAHDLSQQQEHNQQQDGPHAAAAAAAGVAPA